MKKRIPFHSWLFLLLSHATLNGFAQNKSSNMGNSIDYQSIIETVTAIFNGTDARNWNKVSNAFAPSVELDYSSLSGQPAAKLSPDAIVTAWKTVLPGFQHTHHQLGNFAVEQKGKTATISCYGTASHYLPNESNNNIWTVVGTYDFHLTQFNNQWKVDKMVLHFKYQDGNTQLPSLAAEKVKAAANNKTSNDKTANQKTAANKGSNDNSTDQNTSNDKFSNDKTSNQKITNPVTTNQKTTDDQPAVHPPTNPRPTTQNITTQNTNTMSNNITSNNIITRKVQFTSEGLTLTGDLYLPANFDEQKKYPAVIVEGSWITVKEQMAGLYAKRLAQQGLVALAFDFRFFGESEGAPRNYESPESKIVDIKNAFTYLTSLSFVDDNKVSALGICASSGYMARAASEDPRIKKLALVAPWVHNAAIVREVYGGEKGVQEKINAGKEAKKAFAASGEVISVLGVSETDSTAAMYGNFTYYLDAKRGAIPEWPNQFAVMSWPEWLEFDGIQAAGKITVPTLVVHSEQAAIPQGIKQFYSALKSQQKEIHWIDNNQFDFYDQDAAVNFSVQKVANWFK